MNTKRWTVKHDELLAAIASAGFKTQKEFAKQIGISATQLNNILKGRIRTAPRSITIMNIAEALELPPDTVISWFME
jgi:transcriptional regulator with XRE-family HTH domain